MHPLVKKAFSELYPEKEMDFDTRLMYSKAFKGFNAKVKYTKTYMEFRLSHGWKDVSEEIQIGLIQSLFNRIYKTNVKTIEIEFYNIFMKKLPGFSQKTKTDPMLEESFERINTEYFNGMMISPNLEFGGKNFRTLGTYDHGTDTIRISNVLVKDPILLDYVMYHEMLHKKFKYKESGSKTIHHSRQFKEEEKKYNYPDVEDRLKNFLRKEKFRRFWFL
jgi:predicted metal-dependent hydrolase